MSENPYYRASSILKINKRFIYRKTHVRLPMIHKYIFSWFGLLIIAMINGAFRDLAYKPFLGELLSHQVSVGIGISLFGLFIWYLSNRWPLSSSNQAWAIGFIWLSMTVAFEFLFFHYARGVPWSVLLHDYNILEGRVWVLVLVWVTIAPWLIWRWNTRRKDS